MRGTGIFNQFIIHLLFGSIYFRLIFVCAVTNYFLRLTELHQPLFLRISNSVRSSLNRLLMFSLGTRTFKRVF